MAQGHILYLVEYEDSTGGGLQQRMKIIKFYEKYGGSLSALIPHSTRPHRVRRSDIPQEILDFIKTLREKYPRLGHEKIKPLLDR